jgi:hypothetical protein
VIAQPLAGGADRVVRGAFDFHAIAAWRTRAQMPLNARALAFGDLAVDERHYERVQLTAAH